MSFHHKYQIGDLERLPIFEFDLYVDMTAQHIKKKKQEEANA